MTETIDAFQLEKALSMIDNGLGDLQKRDLVSSTEVADLLLDLRMILTFVPSESPETARVG